MKILFVGAFRFYMYEPAFVDALTRLGHQVERFSCSRFFSGLSGRVQAHFPGLPVLTPKINRELREFAGAIRPDAVIVWRGLYLYPGTYRYFKNELGATIVTYNNDDPFGPMAHGRVPWHHHFYWHWYLRSLPLADLSFVFRPVNVQEALEAGATHVELMPPYYIPGKDRPLVLTDSDRATFGCDVVFAGHYEPDGRNEHLVALVRAGLHVRLFGGEYWTRKVLGEAADYFGRVTPVYGDDYTKALCGASMCLCFLSKLNRDVYTTRCFEITACGSLLLCERTSELEDLFRDNREAVYFGSVEELLDKALWLKAHPEEIDRIAAAGRRRVLADGHSVDHRARQLMQRVEAVRTGQ